jgi:hypothetical protein
LVVLSGACLIAWVIAAVKAHQWSEAVDRAEAAWHDALFTHPDRARAAAAYATYLTAKATSREATVGMYGLLIAGFLSVSVIPGLLYASTPSLLGGPQGALMRWGTHNVMNPAVWPMA